MALILTRKSNLLGTSFVLAPERYDARRSLSAGVESVSLGEVVTIIRKTVQPSDTLGPCLVLDTSDAREGFVICRKRHSNDIGSTKKALEVGDVIISRLRPYLRQVAYVDGAIFNLAGATLLCSTEFFVLRSRERKSVAFLVPFLLSSQAQDVFCASQEGGHHPRFDDSTLLKLPMPVSFLEDREVISATVEQATQAYRQAETLLDELVGKAESRLGRKESPTPRSGRSRPNS